VFTLIATAEDSLAATARPRLEAAQADLDRVAFVEMQTDDGLPTGLSLPDDVGELEQLVQECGASLVVVDPLAAHLPAEVNSWRDQSVRLALAPLHALADRQRCAVVLVVHLNKALSAEPLRRIGGSVGIPAAARSVLLLARDPDDGDTRRVLAHVKCNVGPLAPSLLYELEPIRLPATNGFPDVETVRLVEKGESDHQGGDLLGAPVDDDELTAVGEAEEFLRAELADGRRLATELMVAARKVGIAEKTLRRGKANVRVDSHKDGPVWYWSLPATKKAGHPTRPSSPEEGLGHLALLPTNPHGERDSDASEGSLRGKGAKDSDMATLGKNGRNPSFGDSGYLDYVASVHRVGHITTAEALQLERVHKLILGAGGEVS
jgi:AAA domain